MTLTITPAQLKGAVTPPPSKSQVHRLLIAAALGRGESVIHNVALSQDIQATLGCLEELALYEGWVTEEQVHAIGDELSMTLYGKYLQCL